MTRLIVKSLIYNKVNNQLSKENVSN